jgi:hypothetical protein
MWRRLLRLAHPDAGGDDALFVWCRHLQEYVAGDAPERVRAERVHPEPPRRATPADSPRVPYEAAFDRAASFADLTAQAVGLADTVGEPYAALLRLLGDCYDVGESGGPLYRQQNQGATYKQLAAIGHRVGMGKAQRAAWYGIAESVPLSQRHAGHILNRVGERAA